MNELERYKQRFMDGMNLFYEMTGNDPSVCIMGSDDYLMFEVMCKMESENFRPLPKDSKMIGKRTWYSVELFEGSFGVGMMFGKGNKCAESRSDELRGYGQI